MNFAEAEKLLSPKQEARYGKRMLGNNRNLYLHRIDADTFAVRYWQTDIVTIRRDGTYVLNSDGWRTMSTKKFINEFAPVVRVSQCNGIWYVAALRFWNENWDNTLSYQKNLAKWPIYEDGIVIDSQGNVPGYVPERTDDIEKAKRHIDRLVRKYIKGFVEHVMANGQLQSPGAGDCWGCYFKVDGDESGTKQPMGYSHFFEHFKDEYYVPSLFYKAFMERKWNNPGFVWHMINSDIQSGRKPYELAHSLSRYFRRIKMDLVTCYLEEKKAQEEWEREQNGAA